MAKPKKVSQARRGFLKTAAGAAALAGAAPVVKAAPQAAERPNTQPPSAAQRTAETATPSIADVQIVEKPGSDFMVDVIKSLGIEYLFANPGSSFRGLHESIINYGGNKSPSSSPACTKSSSRGHGQRLREDRRQARAGRARTARWACSTRPWRFITPIATRRR